MSLGKCILVAAAASVSSVTFASPVYPLLGCTTDSQTFDVSLTGEGRVTINGTQTDLISVAIVPTQQGKMTSYQIETAQGNSIAFKIPNDPSTTFGVEYWDRGALGGECKTFLVNKAGLQTLAKRTAEISKTKWRLAECAYGPGKFVVDYHEGFVPKTVIVHGSSDDNYVDALITSTSFAGGLSGSLTDLVGEGSYHFFATGHHVRPLSTLSVVSPRKSTPEPAISAGSFRTGYAPFDKQLGECKISNTWHIRELVAAQ